MISLKAVDPENTSRPTTQSSIQSSNSSLFKSAVKSSRKTRYEEEFTFLKSDSSEELENCKADIINDVDVIPHDEFTPLQDFKQSTSIQFSSVGSLDFLNDIPSSCIQFAIQKLSSELRTGDLSGILDSEYTISSKLTPCAMNYDEFSPSSKYAYHRQKVIEEIIETEDSYISSLKMLSGIYLDSLISRGHDGIPIRLIHDYIDMLILNHQSFLTDLRTLFYISNKENVIQSFVSPIFKSKAQDMISCSSSLMAALVSQLISKKAVSLYIYQEFSSLHDLVLKLMSAKEFDPDFGSTLTKVIIRIPSFQ